MATLLITKQTGDYWSFIVDGDTGNEILNTRNDLLTIGDQCHFKTSNGANLIQKQNIFPADITVVASGTFTFTTKQQLFDKLIEKGFFDWITGTGGTGATRFDELEDTFSYIGKDGMAVIVDETELRLIAVPFFNVEKSTDLIDMPSSIVADKMLVTNASGDGYEYADLPTDPEQFLNSVGWFIYNDLVTQTTPIPFVTNVDKKLTNDGIGAGSQSAQAPFGVAHVWNTVTNQLELSELTIGDIVNMRVILEVTTTSTNQVCDIKFKSSIGSPAENYTSFLNVQTKTASTITRAVSVQVVVSSAFARDYPSEFWIVSDGNGSVKVKGFLFSVIRKNINIIDFESDDAKEDISNKTNAAAIVGDE